jgi:hypothetical protein
MLGEEYNQYAEEDFNVFHSSSQTTAAFMIPPASFNRTLLHSTRVTLEVDAEL